MKTIKRIFKLAHFSERASTVRPSLPLAPQRPWWNHTAGWHGLFWLVSSLLMGWVALYAAEHLSTLYVAERMHSIIGLDNGNFSDVDPAVLMSFIQLGNFEANPAGRWPRLLTKTYVLIEYVILLSILAAGLFATLGLYKAVKFIHARHFSMLAKFRRALENDEIDIHYQPIVDMYSGLWKGAEALLRWSVNGRSISPSVFIPVIEQSDMMPRVTRWICQRVVEDHARLVWACDDFYISVNLSAQDVLDPTFADFMQQLLAQYRVPASRIVFEVTEGVALSQQSATEQLNRLRTQGHKIALDDFGTGYSSLSYLDWMPLDIIKIDRSFVVRSKERPADTILFHVLEMAMNLKLSVIVEGVETSAQVERLMALGAPAAQGWFYSKDLPVDELVRGYFSRMPLYMDRSI